MIEPQKIWDAVEDAMWNKGRDVIDTFSTEEIEALIEYIADEDENVRQIAVETLAHRRGT